MKSLRQFYFLLLIFGFYNASLAKPSSHIGSKIEKLIQNRGFKKSSLGIIITDSSFKNIYELNTDKSFIPASLVKVASLSAFYKYYPHYFRFKTALASNATVQNQELKGDLVFQGGGDPSFTSESLWNLINSFTRTGIKKINGNIVVDNSLYKKSYKLKYTDRSYTATASASSFNWNSLTFWIRPGKKAGDLAEIHSGLENNFIKVINKVKTVKSGKQSIFLKRTRYSKRGEVFIISGSIRLGSKEVAKYSNVQHPEYYLGYAIKDFLKQRGISVTGAVKMGTCSNCKVLTEIESKSFHVQTQSMMKHSSNFITRMMTAHLPLVNGKNRGDLKEGVKLIDKYLKNEVGLRNYRLVEPSGLSRRNKFSANHFKKLLQKDISNFYHAEMLSTYPLVDGEGTLKKRFLNKNEQVHIRAKTGLLSGVGSLLGHAKSNNKEIFFIFLFNGSRSKTYAVRSLFDEIVLEVI